MQYNYKLEFDTDTKDWSFDPDPELSAEDNAASIILLPFILATILRDQLHPKGPTIHVTNPNERTK